MRGNVITAATCVALACVACGTLLNLDGGGDNPTPVTSDGGTDGGDDGTTGASDGGGGEGGGDGAAAKDGAPDADASIPSECSGSGQFCDTFDLADSFPARWLVTKTAGSTSVEAGTGVGGSNALLTNWPGTNAQLARPARDFAGLSVNGQSILISFSMKLTTPSDNAFVMRIVSKGVGQTGLYLESGKIGVDKTVGGTLPQPAMDVWVQCTLTIVNVSASWQASFTMSGASTVNRQLNGVDLSGSLQIEFGLENTGLGASPPNEAVLFDDLIIH